MRILIRSSLPVLANAELYVQKAQHKGLFNTPYLCFSHRLMNVIFFYQLNCLSLSIKVFVSPVLIDKVSFPLPDSFIADEGILPTLL